MNYKDLNVFDLASILSNISFDEDLNFSIIINDVEISPFFRVNVDDGQLSIIIKIPSIELVVKDNV